MTNDIEKDGFVTVHPPLPAPSGAPISCSRPSGADAYFYARAVIDDLLRFEDSEILWACDIVIRTTKSEREKARAEDLRCLVVGETHQCGQIDLEVWLAENPG